MVPSRAAAPQCRWQRTRRVHGARVPPGRADSSGRDICLDAGPDGPPLTGERMYSAEPDHLLADARTRPHLHRLAEPDCLAVGEPGAIQARFGSDPRIQMPPRHARNHAAPRSASQRGNARHQKRHKGRLPTRQRQLGRNSCGMPRRRTRHSGGFRPPAPHTAYADVRRRSAAALRLYQQKSWAAIGRPPGRRARSMQHGTAGAKETSRTRRIYKSRLGGSQNRSGGVSSQLRGMRRSARSTAGGTQ